MCLKVGEIEIIKMMISWLLIFIVNNNLVISAIFER